MYAIVLMAALSGNADDRVQEGAGNSLYHQTHEYRFRRGHGCCGGGCYGGSYGGCCGGSYGGCHSGYVSPGYGCCGGRAYSAGAMAGPAPYRSYYGPPAYPATSYAPLPSDRAGDFRVEQPRRDQAEIAPAAWSEQVRGNAPASAMLVVNVPENAKVFIDDKPTQSTGETRTYVSPPLPPTGEFHYTVRAEIVREGRTIATGKQVTVRAGQPSQVTLDMSAFAPGPKP
jgi:uncharacterized protein (TIGR03000 family)